MEGVAFCPYSNNTYPEYGFAFAACNAFAKIAMHELTEHLTHHQGVPHSITSEQEPRLMAHVVQK